MAGSRSRSLLTVSGFTIFPLIVFFVVRLGLERGGKSLYRESPVRLSHVRSIEQEERLRTYAVPEYLGNPCPQMQTISEGLHLLFLSEGKGVSNVRPSAREIFGAILQGNESRWMKPIDPVFYRAVDGSVRAEVKSNLLGESHPGMIVATAGAMGILSTEHVKLRGETISFSEAIASQIDLYSTADEPEWNLLGCLFYLPPVKGWRNRWGEAFTFSSESTRLMSQPLGTGACAGTHRLFVLAAILQINSEHRILDDGTSAKILAFLEHAVLKLRQNQQSDGSWSIHWAEPLSTTLSATYQGQSSLDRIRVTSHHLEWLLLCDQPTLQLPPLSVDSALRFCESELARTPVEVFYKRVCPFTHVERVLRIYSKSDE
jgi:hypothetical protein